MTRYWINIKGKQSGPHSVDELSRMGVDKSAYVWHSGLDDWVKITKVPELNEMLENMASGTYAGAASPADDVVPEIPDNEVPDIPNDEVPETPNDLAYNANNAMNNNVHDRWNNPQDNYSRNDSGAFAASQSATAAADAPKCPPTNLVWAIILTFCCCTPLGILAIIFAYQTKKHYQNGNYEKAQRYSDYGAWACIASIMIGLITTPLSCAFLNSCSMMA